MNLQISGETVGEVRTVLDMHERKAEMAREADAFIALPGKKVPWPFSSILENKKGTFGESNCYLMMEIDF